MGVHHKNGPSTIGRRFLCSYSGVIEPTLPNRSSAASIEGDMLHGRMETNNFNGLTEEQVLACEWSNDCLTSILEEHGDPLEFHKELYMELLNNDGVVITAGTADIVLVYESYVIVLDWKFGRGWVNAKGNSQTSTYGLMAMQYFDKDMSYGYIVQPRCNYFDHEITYYSAEYIDYINEALERVASATLVDAKPSAKACQYCRARNDCPAMRQANTELAKVEHMNIQVMTVEEVEVVLHNYDLVTTKLQGIMKEIEARFEEGGDLGHLFEMKQEWKAEAVMFADLVDHISIDNLLGKGFTVTQAEFVKAYKIKHKKGVRGEMAQLELDAVEIYKKIKGNRRKPKGMKIKRLK